MVTIIYNSINGQERRIALSVKEKFAERARLLRESRGLTTRMLADELDISHGAISLYEGAKRTAGAEVIRKYTEYFNVSPDYLLGITDHSIKDRK